MKGIPDYWLRSPDMTMTQEEQAAFEEIYNKAIEQKEITEIQYNLAAPKWRFLNYLVEKHHLFCHGSGNREITLFEPRKANDISEFGNQHAVFAAADGIWPMFYAIIDRETYPMIVSSGCIQFVENGMPVSESLYLFSISQGMRQKKPWRTGSVYLLPSETFIKQPIMQFGEHQVSIKQRASLVHVKPIAHLEITPEDFPFLSKIREHDDSRIEAYASAIQTGAAWPQ